MRFVKFENIAAKGENCLVHPAHMRRCIFGRAAGFLGSSGIKNPPDCSVGRGRCELAAFAQFGSELDADTTEKLAQGERIREILKQPQYQPMPVEKQVMIIYAATKKYLIDIPVEKILDFEKALFEYVDTKYPEVPEAIRTEKVISDETEAKLVKAIEECKADFLK